MKEKIRKWYQLKLWTSVMVHDAVVRGIISADDYNEIVGADE